MARTFSINGETLVKVKGATGGPISSLSELGLADGPIKVTLIPNRLDIHVDAFGGSANVVPEKQQFPARAKVSMSLCNVDRTVLKSCESLAIGNATTYGTMVAAGTLMGGGVARLAAGWKYVGLNLLSPVGALPYRFYAADLVDSIEIPLGTERSIFVLVWDCIPYAADPATATGVVLFDNTLDT